MMSPPFSPELQQETENLENYVRQEAPRNEEVKCFAESLEKRYGSLSYGLFAAKARLWIFESLRTWIDLNLSYAAKILSGQATLRQRLDSKTVDKEVTKFEESFRDRERAKQIVKALQDNSGSSENVARKSSQLSKPAFARKERRPCLFSPYRRDFLSPGVAQPRRGALTFEECLPVRVAEKKPRAFEDILEVVHGPRHRSRSWVP
jgi:hypothetical protein